MVAHGGADGTDRQLQPQREEARPALLAPRVSPRHLRQVDKHANRQEHDGHFGRCLCLAGKSSSSGGTIEGRAGTRPATGRQATDSIKGGGSMIGLDVRMKKYFFNTRAVEQRLGEQRARTLRNAGGYARTTAIRSMRRAGKKGKPSPEGQPPRYHGGNRSLRTIIYAMDPVRESVVIGPIRFNQKQYYGSTIVHGSVPALQEGGGDITVREKMVGAEWRPMGRRKPRPGQATRNRNVKLGARPYMQPAQKKTVERLRAKDTEIYFG